MARARVDRAGNTTFHVHSVAVHSASEELGQGDTMMRQGIRTAELILGPLRRSTSLPKSTDMFASYGVSCKQTLQGPSYKQIPANYWRCRRLRKLS